jgi:GNAT superfamily N-acetyltransferase
MMRASVRVRPAEPADIPGLVELVRSAEAGVGTSVWEPGGGELTARLREIIETGVRTLLVAVDDASGAVVGLLVAHPDQFGAIDLTPVLHVSHLLVAPRLRRRGIGRALLAGAVHLADSQGTERILATVASGSREGNRYLARLGFAPLVTHRVATTGVLRRSLGLADAPTRVAMLRRSRLVRAHRVGARALRPGA